MTATIPDDVTAATKPKRLGRECAFGSDYGAGLSTREYMATAAMQGLLADGVTREESEIAARAVRVADALLREMAK